MGSTPAFVVFAVLLEILAGLAVAAEAALSSFSKARAEELIEDDRPGSKRLRSLLDDPARFLSSLLLLRLVFELTAVVLVSFVIFGTVWISPGADPSTVSRRLFMLMVLVSFEYAVAVAWTRRPVAGAAANPSRFTSSMVTARA